ncbi:MAG TPA: sigma-54 dependent transcriptional regulator [Thermoanaerobaculia bacterium]|nr:sigma-54 dependent transcriptional regulator [Thermoanaerobaculia bacterium]
MPPTVSLDILIVDDEPNIRRTLALSLEGRGHRVRAVGTSDEAIREAGRQRFDVALVDLRLGTGSGLDLLASLRAEDPGLKILVITAYASIETAVEAMKRGASDYLAKPFDPLELDLAIDRVVALSSLERKVQALEGNLAAAESEAELISSAPVMRQVLRMARQVADSEMRVLLRGESGTGKGVLARAIHDWSGRRDRPFVVVPCPALPAELLESELFGHARGAFTGATRNNPGRVALAEGGTVLLDEIGDLPLALQPKLLRFIQEREYERVGDPTPRRADVRILAATNRDLEQSVREGRFREDLFYRLNVLTLELPPLRERREDIRPLAEHFVRFFGRQYHRPGLALSPAAVSLLGAYGWPGNVRELRNAVERATMLAEDSAEIGPGLLLAKPAAPAASAYATAVKATAGPPGPPQSPAAPVTPPPAAPSSPSSNVADSPAAKASSPAISGADPQGGETALGDLLSLSEIEQEHIRRVVARTSSLKEAAAVLGIDQATLWRRRKQHGL